MGETIKLDEKVTVRSIAPWATGARRQLSVGDIMIQPKGSVSLTREEIIAQAQTGNKLFTGIDGIGTHSTWYIQDDYTRKELGFDTEDFKQSVISNEEIKKIFDLKTRKSFEENIQKRIITRAEKCALMAAIKDLKINDYDRIVFCEHHSGNKL